MDKNSPEYKLWLIFTSLWAILFFGIAIYIKLAPSEVTMTGDPHTGFVGILILGLIFVPIASVFQYLQCRAMYKKRMGGRSLAEQLDPLTSWLIKIILRMKK